MDLRLATLKAVKHELFYMTHSFSLPKPSLIRFSQVSFPRTRVYTVRSKIFHLIPLSATFSLFSIQKRYFSSLF
jgi:hypothetical protein